MAVESSACEWWTETADRFEPCHEPRRAGNSRYCAKHFQQAIATMRREEAARLSAAEWTAWERRQTAARLAQQQAEARSLVALARQRAREAVLARERVEAQRQAAVEEAQALERVASSRRRLEAARAVARAAAHDRQQRQREEDAQLAADRYEWRVLGTLEDAPLTVEAYSVAGYDRFPVDYRATLDDEDYYADAYELLTWRDTRA